MFFFSVEHVSDRVHLLVLSFKLMKQKEFLKFEKSVLYISLEM